MSWGLEVLGSHPFTSPHPHQHSPQQNAHHTFVLSWVKGLGRRKEGIDLTANSTRAGWSRETRLI